MLRKLALSMAVAGAIASSQVNALGLGDIRIKSALNEPLIAEIQLSQVRDLNPLQIRPRMAGQDEFALAGISQQRALSGVRFQVKVNPNGTGVIELTSREPVKEPFLNFLVEVNWPSGRLVREYTVLLDPPVFDPSPTQQPLGAAVTRQPVMPQVQSSRAQVSTPASPKPPVSNIKTRVNKQTQTYVDVKDTLWGLAIEHRAAPGVSSYQMMVALYKKNPAAFPDNNINNLKAGSVLQLPTEAEARAISSKEAAAEVRRQTAAWKNRGKASAPAPIDGSKASLKSDAAESKEVETAPEGQLKVVTPTDVSKDDAALNSQNPVAEEEATTAAAEAKELQAKNEVLEEKLAVSLESIDRLERDNSDLNDKLDAIQQQLDSLQRLIELKDQKMSVLQQELQDQQAAALVESEKSLLDKILETPAYLAGIGGGVLAALLGLFFLLRRKKKEDESVDDEALIAPVAMDSIDDEVSDDELLAALGDEEEKEAASTEEASEEIDLDDISSLDELESLDDLDDLDDLDLDMDLNLDESLDNDISALSGEDNLDELPAEDDALDDLDSILDEETVESLEVEDDEFDLGLDDLDGLEGLEDEVEETAEEAVAEAGTPSENENADDELGSLDDSLDAMLAADLDDVEEPSLDAADESTLDDLITLDLEGEDDLDKSRQSNERSGMGVIDELGEEDEVDETLESLGLDALADQPFEAKEDAEEAKKLDESESDELEFNVAAPSEKSLEDEMSELEAELDGLDFALDDDEAEESAIDESLEDLADIEELSEVDSELDTLDMAELEGLDVDDDEEVTVGDLDELLEEETLDEEKEATADEAELMADLDSMLDGELDLDDVAEASDLKLEGESLAAVADDLDDLDLDDLLNGADLNLEDDEALGLAEEESEDALEDLLDLDLDESAEVEADVDVAGTELDDRLPPTPSDEEVTEELTANIEHDLDAELDDELEALLNSTDNDIALEETSSEDNEPEEDPFDALGLLDGADEVETKLDLARAYIDMGDLEGAKDILDEIVDEGNDAQKTEAQQLLEGLA